MRANALDIASAASQFGPADMASVRAFHGSPYDFNAFDTSKIGTGEGAQAYGHGLYFAGNEGVARAYRDQLAGKGRALEWNGTKVEPGAPFYNLVDQLSGKDWRLGQIVEHAGKYDPASAIAAYEPHTRNASDGPAWQSAMDKFKEGVGSAATGKMYEVSLNANPEHFLDWDKPLSEQSQHVQDVLEGLGIPTDKEPRWSVKSSPDGERHTVYNVWGEASGTFKSKEAAEAKAAAGTAAHNQGAAQLAYTRLGGNTFYPNAGNSADASQKLRDAGIPGIKYLDQGSRASGQGTSNYVVFDPKTIEILRKYGIAGLMAGSTAAASTSSQDQQ
jgi:hypothetical protein